MTDSPLNLAESRSNWISWIQENQGCGMKCGKCMGRLADRFARLPITDRSSLVTFLCAQELDALAETPSALWFVTLFTEREYDRFVDSLLSRTPFSRDDAFKIIHHSVNNRPFHARSGVLPKDASIVGSPFFHLHPRLAPVLLDSVLGPKPARQDVLSLIEFFHPMASSYPALSAELPEWEAEKRHQEEERARVRQEETTRRQAAIRLFADLSLEEQLRAILTNWTYWDTLSPNGSWAELSNEQLATISDDLLQEVIRCLQGVSRWDSWGTLRRRLRQFLNDTRRGTHYLVRSKQRANEIAALEEQPLPDRLLQACRGRWPLTYYPESWATAAKVAVSALSYTIRTELLKKLRRLRRRSAWRELKRALAQWAARGVVDPE